MAGPRRAIAIPGPDGPWGVLVIDAGPGADPFAARRGRSSARVAIGVGAIVAAARQADEVRHQLHRADALRRVAGDIGSRLDLDQILSGLVDHAMVLFEADRGRGLPPLPERLKPSPRSAAACRRPTSSRVREFPVRSLPSLAVAARRPLFASGYSDDPRGEGVRAAVVQEGFDTICTAPLFDGPEVLGLLNVYHDSAARLDRRRARHDGGPRDAGVGRDQERPELREDGDLGRPAPARSSSSACGCRG